MPRLIKASLDPGKLRSTAEASRGGYKRPAEKDAAKVASEVIGLTGAVMKHPVTDLIVRGVNELVLLGKKDTPGYERLLEQRRERLKQKAARRKAGPAPTAVKPRITPFTDVASGTSIGESFDRAAEVEMARAKKQPAPAAPPAAMPPVAEDRGTVLPMIERAMDGKPPVKKVEEPKIEIPRTVEEIMAFVANPIASPEDLNWAMTQVAKFAPVLGLDDIGRPKTAYSSVILESYAKGKKRVPTELDLQKQAVKEREVRLKETGALDKQTTRKEEIIKVSFLEKAKDARARLAASAAKAKETGRRQDKTSAAKIAIDNLRDIAQAYKTMFANKSLSVAEVAQLEGMYREVKQALKDATKGSGTYQNALTGNFVAYFNKVFAAPYTNPLDSKQELGSHANLKEADAYVKRSGPLARSILTKDAADQRKEYVKIEAAQREEARIATNIGAAQREVALTKKALAQAIRNTGKNPASLNLKLRKRTYTRTSKKGIPDKGVSDAFDAYNSAKRKLTTARSRDK